MPGLTEFIFGSRPKTKKLATGTPEQQAFGQNLISQLTGMQGSEGAYGLSQNYLQNILGGQGYEQFSQPYLQQFQEQLLPMLEERYAGMGGLSSSGFGQAIGGATAGLQSQLAQLFSGLQQQAAQTSIGNYQQLANLGLNYQPFAYQQKQGSVGALIPLLTSLISGASGIMRGGI